MSNRENPSGPSVSERDSVVLGSAFDLFHDSANEDPAPEAAFTGIDL